MKKSVIARIRSAPSTAPTAVPAIVPVLREFWEDEVLAVGEGVATVIADEVLAVEEELGTVVDGADSRLDENEAETGSVEEVEVVEAATVDVAADSGVPY